MGSRNAGAFAYPYGDVNPTLEAIVAGCGYASGRALGGIKSGTICRSCPYAEKTSPRNRNALRTLRHLTTSTSLAELQGYVTEAENHGGGWVILVFHGICNDRCTGTYSYSTRTFTDFLNWLGSRAQGGTVVKTVREVMTASG